LEFDQNGGIPKSYDKSANLKNDDGTMVSSEGFDDYFQTRPNSEIKHPGTFF
jgi:hypothetical protein